MSHVQKNVQMYKQLKNTFYNWGSYLKDYTLLEYWISRDYGEKDNSVLIVLHGTDNCFAPT